jgi:hypothetical protein
MHLSFFAPNSWIATSSLFHRIETYLDGNVEITGTLVKPGLAFKNDHPLDPTSKYLYHSSVESPDMRKNHGKNNESYHKSD